nr:MAG TPA: hypothetical protein [Caudoviricetes sp.]
MLRLHIPRVPLLSRRERTMHEKYNLRGARMCRFCSNYGWRVPDPVQIRASTFTSRTAAHYSMSGDRT